MGGGARGRWKGLWERRAGSIKGFSQAFPLLPHASGTALMRGIGLGEEGGVGKLGGGAGGLDRRPSLGLECEGRGVGSKGTDSVLADGVKGGLLCFPSSPVACSSGAVCGCGAGSRCRSGSAVGRRFSAGEGAVSAARIKRLYVGFTPFPMHSRVGNGREQFGECSSETTLCGWIRSQMVD